MKGEGNPEGPPRGPRRGAFTVLYDGNCPLCRASVTRLRHRDAEGTLRFLPTQDPAVAEEFAWLPSEALDGSLHLVGPNRETWEGAAAVERMMRLLPGWRRGAWLFHLPWARPLVRRVYRWVARNRYRLGCGLHCREGAPGGGELPRTPHRKGDPLPPH